MTEPSTKEALRHDRGPNKWLDAAIKTLIEEGVDAVRVERLATRMGFSRGSFYHHYQDREALLRAVLEHYLQINHQNLVEMLPVLKGTPQDKLWTLWTATASQEFRDYDWAIRMWGMHDKHVAEVLKKIDVKRMEVMIGLFMEMGFTEDEANIRAALAYHGSLGDRAFFGPFPPMAKRLEWRHIALDILTHRP
jgi:AcrR family transcriptional regulator